MYYLLSLLSGILISAMLASNGILSEYYGVYSSTILIHIVGLILIALITFIKRDFRFKKLPFYLFIGGIIGVAPTAFCSIAFGKISLSAILALELLGQSVLGLVFDSFGLLGVQKRKFRKRNLLGISLILIGIVSMIGKFNFIAVAVSFTSGALLVVSQILNAKLSENIGIYSSTLFNYVTGLITAVLICIIFGKNEPMFSGFSFSPKLYMYMGGILGVCMVLISNIITLKISVFYKALFVFIGQIFSGILLDAILAQAFPLQNIIGGALTSAGLILNLLLDKKYQ